MRVLGIDFTSAPSGRKPITCLQAQLSGNTLAFESLTEWTDFSQFENALVQSGPWIAGLDLPFGQSRRFIQNIGWPDTWAGCMTHVASMTRQQFRSALDDYRRDRPPGDKEHRRRCDIQVGAISPQKLYGVPVGLMYFEGAPRIYQSGVTIPGLHEGDPSRIAIEAYPGLLARTLIGRRSYKNDTRRKQSPDHMDARVQILDQLTTDGVLSTHGTQVDAPRSLAEDPTGDHLDSLLCAVQAAWAWQQRDRGFGMPADMDRLEGWIVDPGAVELGS